MNRERALENLKAQYGHVEVIDEESGRYLAYYRLMFHWTLISGYLDEEWGYDDRWCYDERQVDGRLLVAHQLEEWRSRGFSGEPEGWHRHPKSGRRRPRGDARAEYVAH